MADLELANTNSNQVSLGEGLYVDIEDQVLIHKGFVVPLSRIQFRILFVLIKNMGHPVSNEDLIRSGWGKQGLMKKTDLYVFINRLRSRLEDDPKNPKCLLSIRGYGYVLYPKSTL